MSADDGAQTYLAVLAELLRFLQYNTSVLSRAENIAATAAAKYQDVIAATNYPNRSHHISIEPNFRVPITQPTSICGDAGSAELFIGGEIHVKESAILRQCIVVTITFRPDHDVTACEGRPAMTAKVNHVVRRFHFDFDHEISLQDRPNHHLQIGGKFSEVFLRSSAFLEDGFEYRLMSEMDRPRMAIPPADLAGVMDAFLHQFDNPIQDVLQESAWIKSVAAAEGIWLRQYFDDVANELGRTSRDQTLYRYLCDRL